MKFNKEDLRDLANFGGPDYLELVIDEHAGNSRWSESRLMIFKDMRDGKIYGVEYSRGLTEMQYEQPFEYHDEEIECEEYEQQTYTATRWVRK